MGAAAPAVLIVLAHPDDEAFGTGGTIALLAERGARVYILLATRGEAGTIADPALDTPLVRQQLAQVREAEARAAAAELGACSVQFLGYPDGQLATYDEEALTREVVRVIRQLRPAVVITGGPEGIYGHPDHVAISRVVTAAVELAPDAAFQTNGLAPHRVARLFYQVLSKTEAERLNAHAGSVRLGDQDLPFQGYPDGAITTRVDAGAFVERKLAAIACHRSQVGAKVVEVADWLTEGLQFEKFILASQEANAVPGLASDLLAGLWPTPTNPRRQKSVSMEPPGAGELHREQTGTATQRG